MELANLGERLDQLLHPQTTLLASPDFAREVCDLAGSKSSDGTSPSFVSTSRACWPSGSEMVMECEITWAKKHLLSFSADNR